MGGAHVDDMMTVCLPGPSGIGRSHKKWNTRIKMEACRRAGGRFQGTRSSGP